MVTGSGSRPLVHQMAVKCPRRLRRQIANGSLTNLCKHTLHNLRARGGRHLSPRRSTDAVSIRRRVDPGQLDANPVAVGLDRRLGRALFTGHHGCSHRFFPFFAAFRARGFFADPEDFAAGVGATSVPEDSLDAAPRLFAASARPFATLRVVAGLLSSSSMRSMLGRFAARSFGRDSTSWYSDTPIGPVALLSAYSATTASFVLHSRRPIDARSSSWPCEARVGLGLDLHDEDRPRPAALDGGGSVPVAVLGRLIHDGAEGSPGEILQQLLQNLWVGPQVRKAAPRSRRRPNRLATAPERFMASLEHIAEASQGGRVA